MTAEVIIIELESTFEASPAWKMVLSDNWCCFDYFALSDYFALINRNTFYFNLYDQVILQLPFW